MENREFFKGLCSVRVSAEILQTVLAVYLLTTGSGSSERELSLDEICELTGLEPEEQEKALLKAVELNMISRHQVRGFSGTSGQE